MLSRRAALKASASTAVVLSAGASAETTRPATPMPAPDHIVVVVLENHSFSQIIDGNDAPFIQELAQGGALFTRSFAHTHPSQPNYFALFSGSTHGVTDNNDHTLDGPTLADALAGRGKTFLGYAEDGAPRKHKPWASFRRVEAVGRSFRDFPQDFSTLPTVSFVVPNDQNNMHDGSIAQADRWLGRNLDRYAQWCMTHDSLLVVTFDEDDGSERNRIPTLFVGESVVPGRYDQRIDHYGVLRTILALTDLPPLGRAAFATPISGIWRGEFLQGRSDGLQAGSYLRKSGPSRPVPGR